MRMLLVEDDAAIVASLTDLLRSEGYETRCADGQDAAVELLRSERFDLALVDVALAQGNGFAVCAAAKACDPAPAVIFLTASDDEFSTVAGLDMGADDYIAKPFRARELLDVYKRQLYDLADLFKVFGDTTRIKMLYALMGQELCVADLAELIGATQSAVSHQLRTLKQARLVKFQRDGKNVIYSLSDDHVYTMLAQGMTHICE